MDFEIKTHNPLGFSLILIDSSNRRFHYNKLDHPNPSVNKSELGANAIS